MSDRRHSDRRGKTAEQIEAERRQEERRTLDRREFLRLPVSLWAMEETDDAAYFHYIREISAGGLFFEKRLPLAPGTAVRLEFKLPDGTIIKTQGTVVRASDDAKEDLSGGNGVQFNGLALSDAEALARFLTELQSI